MSWTVDFDAAFRDEFRTFDADVRKAIAAVRVEEAQDEAKRPARRRPKR